MFGGKNACLELEDALRELLDEGLRVLNRGGLPGRRLLAPAGVLVVDGLFVLAIRDLRAFFRLVSLFYLRA